MFATLQAHQRASLALALDEASSLTIELRTDGSRHRYYLRFWPPPGFAERWRQLYPAQLTIERWPGGAEPAPG